MYYLYKLHDLLNMLYTINTCKQSFESPFNGLKKFFFKLVLSQLTLSNLKKNKKLGDAVDNW